MLKLSIVFRMLIFLPVVTPVAVIGIVRTFQLRPFNGAINGLLLDTVYHQHSTADRAAPFMPCEFSVSVPHSSFVWALAGAADKV